MHTPGEARESGVPLSTIRLADPSTRYDVRGELEGGVLELDDLQGSRVQTRPDPRRRHLQELGCVGGFLLADWLLLMSDWEDSPLDRATVSTWSFGDDGQEEFDPQQRTLLGTVVVVKWMTDELYEWVRTVPPANLIRIAPIVANDEADLLPW